jgi:hypothetical protein
MKFPFTRGHLHRLRWLPALAAALLAGCASPGQPRPPSLDLPEPVKDLTAERIGNQVLLHWTTPEKTTDRIAVQGSMTAAICRITAPSSTCTPIIKFQTQSGPAQATDTLPQTLTSEPATLLAYRVEILNAKGHSAGLSPEAFAASGSAPTPLANFRATPTRDGAMLEWQPQPASAPPAQVELERLPVDANGNVIQPTPKPAKSPKPPKPAPKSRQAKPAAQPSPQKSLLPAPPTPAEVKLRTPAAPSDPGGTIDHTAQMGETYSYTAQRVRTVSFIGHTLEIRTAISSPATVVMRNTFAPHAPTGLEAIPGGATPTEHSIDLSWTPNTDPDLAGYNVYRQDIDSNGVAAGTAARLNQTPVAGPAYRDQTAVPGRRYAYRVTAVDTAGNESAPSADVQETAREQ